MTDFLETLRTPRERTEAELRDVIHELAVNVRYFVGCADNGYVPCASNVAAARLALAKWELARRAADDARLAEILSHHAA